MATPSGAPPNQTPVATTNSISGDKKKLFIGLAVAGVAVLGLGGYFLMHSRSGAATDAATNAATANSAAPVTPEGAAPGASGGAPGSTLSNGGIAPEGSGAGVTQVSTGNNPATLLPLSPYRRDPFQPFVVLPPPPTPVPPAPRPTPIPPPVVIPRLDVDVPTPGGGGVFGGGSGGAFPVPGVGGGGSGLGSLVLPQVVIPRLNGNPNRADQRVPAAALIKRCRFGRDFALVRQAFVGRNYR